MARWIAGLAIGLSLSCTGRKIDGDSSMHDDTAVEGDSDPDAVDGDSASSANGVGNEMPNDDDAEPRPADPDAAYPYCTWLGSGGYETFCPRTMGGHGYLNWHVDGDDASLCTNDESCNTCLCYAGCKVTSDCPAPESGTAAPDCVQNTCYLRCDDDVACPDDMRCVPAEPGLSMLVCAWVND